MRKLLIISLLLALPAVSLAGEEVVPTVLTNAEAVKGVQTNLDYVWTLIAAALVFFMQASFAMVEAGFTRAKSAINILMKNLMDFSMGSIFFWAIGFGIMFGATTTGWFGTTGFFLSDFKIGGVIPGYWPSGCSSVCLPPLRLPLCPAPWRKERNSPVI